MNSDVQDKKVSHSDNPENNNDLRTPHNVKHKSSKYAGLNAKNNLTKSRNYIKFRIIFLCEKAL